MNGKEEGGSTHRHRVGRVRTEWAAQNVLVNEVSDVGGVCVFSFSLQNLACVVCRWAAEVLMKSETGCGSTCTAPS